LWKKTEFSEFEKQNFQKLRKNFKKLTKEHSLPSCKKDDLVEADEGTDVQSRENGDVAPDDFGFELVLKIEE
jgi:hypothetical protein